MELDSSGFQEQLKDKDKEVKKAYADKVSADNAYDIQKIQNESDRKAALNAFDLAVIDEQKYIEGDYVQSLKDVDGRIETARSDLDSRSDRAAWSNRMLQKGLMSKVQADADQSRLDGARFALQKVEEEKRVLTDFMKKRT